MPVAPTNSSSVISDSVPKVTSGLIVDTRLRDFLELDGAEVTKSSSTPRMNPKSPMRLTMKAFLPASEADFFWY